MESYAQLSHCDQDPRIKDLALLSLSVPFRRLVEMFRKPKINTDKFKVGFFVHYAATQRGAEFASNDSNLLVIDADKRLIDGVEVNGAPNPHWVHLLLNHLNIDHILYSSFSNNVDLNKYRVVIPTPYTREQMPIILDWLFERMHENDVMLAPNKESKTYSQIWFKPCSHPDRVHLYRFYSRVDGVASHPLPIEFEPADQFDVETICARHQRPANKIVPLVARVPIANSSSPIQAFNAAYPLTDFLLSVGYTKTGVDRYKRPNSTSGAGALKIIDGLAFSHGDDALNDGKKHDAFDCYKILVCNGDYRQALNWNAELTKSNQRAHYA